MTIILLTSLSAFLISIFGYRFIRKYRYYIFAITAMLVLVFGTEEANIVSFGYVPLGLFLVVMFSGVLNKGLIRKRLFMVRAELAIIASIFLIPHVLAFLEYYLDDIGFFNANISFYFGVLALVVMIPLSVTSFRFIRKYFSYQQWKLLHRLSYLFYGLIAGHLILIQNDRMILYIVMFSVYTLLKIQMMVSTHTLKKAKSHS